MTFVWTSAIISLLAAGIALLLVYWLVRLGSKK